MAFLILVVAAAAACHVITVSTINNLKKAHFPVHYSERLLEVWVASNSNSKELRPRRWRRHRQWRCVFVFTLTRIHKRRPYIMYYYIVRCYLKKICIWNALLSIFVKLMGKDIGKEWEKSLATFCNCKPNIIFFGIINISLLPTLNIN